MDIKLRCSKSTEGTLWGIFLISQEATGPLMVDLVLTDKQDLLSGGKNG